MTDGGGDPKLRTGSDHWCGHGVPHINKAF